MKKLLLVAAALGALATPVFADDPAELGAAVFKKNCFACHKVGDGAKNAVGPTLNGVFGRTAGTLDTYKKYSKAMKAAGEGGLVWSEEKLHEYLPNPRAYVKGTTMTFVGLKKDEDITNLVQYLLQFSPDYTPAE